MKHYDFAQKFRALHDKAVGLYAKGQRGADTFFSADEKAWLAGHGLNSQHLYDYAEDQNGYGEPGVENAIAIEVVRHNYFHSIQKGQASHVVLDVDQMPSKSETVRGIEWLPRLLPKAKAKLRGELPAALMYCCGGDRNFFKTHDILPAEFLGVVWRFENDDQAIVDWVVSRSAAAKK